MDAALARARAWTQVTAWARPNLGCERRLRAAGCLARPPSRSRRVAIQLGRQPLAGCAKRFMESPLLCGARVQTTNTCSVAHALCAAQVRGARTRGTFVASASPEAQRRLCATKAAAATPPFSPAGRCSAAQRPERRGPTAPSMPRPLPAACPSAALDADVANAACKACLSTSGCADTRIASRRHAWAVGPTPQHVVPGAADVSAIRHAT